MNNQSRWQFVTAIALLAALGAVWGCAQDVEDIDRTQPDKLERTLFETDDEWYLQQTIVDTGMEGGNIGQAGDGMFITPAFETQLKRIRWTVTEDVLYAHSSVELADGLNEGFDEEDARREGVVAAFPITDHFDVQRQYDASTGEPTNVITEDRSDRPWYERDYMRVDWSTNMVDGFQMFKGTLGQFSSVSDGVPQDDDEIHPHRTRISDEYIDTVTEYSYEPDINTCFGAYGFDSIFSCEGGRLSIRTSLKRVPDEETYEPLNHLDAHSLNQDDDPASAPLETASIFDRDLGYLVEVECTDEVRDWMKQNPGYDYEDRCSPAKFEFHERFGYFRTERVEWDRYVGTSDDQRQYHINRWNIWQTMLDDDGNVKPPEDRTPKPITFHLNMEYPKFMFDAADRTAAEWDDTFRNTVKLAMDIDAEQLDAKLEEEYGHTEMFRIVENSCHPGPLVEWFDEHGSSHPDDQMHVSGIFDNYVNTTSAGDDMEERLWNLSHEARGNMCAEIEYATQTRPDPDAQFTWEQLGDLRYSLFNWVEENTGMWAGYGPSAADPKTGEIIRANANFAGQGIRQNATYAADLIQYFNGELSQNDILHGVQIRDDLFNNDRDETKLGMEPEARRQMAMRSGIDPDEISESGFEERPSYEDLDSFVHKHGLDRIQQEADIVAKQGSKNAANDQRMVEFLENPQVKSFLMSNVETAMAVEANARDRHGDNFDDEQFHQAYLDFHTPRHFHDRRHEAERMLSERNILTQESVHRSLETLVTYQGVADYFAGADRDDIKEHFLNELFIGTQLHEIGHAVGLRHNFSGHSDALNYHEEFWKIEEAVIDGRLDREDAYSLQGELAQDILGDDDVEYASQAEFKLSTVMDYTGDLTGRFAGLGRYDRAAIKFGYGELVERWDDDVELVNAIDTYSILTDYADLPYLMAGNQSGAGDSATFSEGVDIILNSREYVAIDDAMEDRREHIRENTDNWFSYGFEDGALPHEDRTVDYEFCSDEFNGQILDCATWVYGGNQQEMVNHAFDTFRAFQTFWRHRRHHIDRNYDNLNAYFMRLMRTIQTTQEPFRYYSIYRWMDLGDYTADLERAAIDGFNFYNELLAMPQPGRHCYFEEDASDVDPWWFYDLENVYVPADYHLDEGQCGDYVDIPRGVGQEYNFKFTDEYMYRIDRVGSFIDKMVATQMLFDISAEFAQSAFFTDFRATNLSYWTVFQDEMLEMMGGMILGDYKAYAPKVNGGNIEFPEPVDPSAPARLTDDDDDTPRVFTPQSVNHEFNLMVGGLLYASTWEDRAPDFTHYVKVATTESERQEFGEGIDTVEFVHPVTGQVYTAADIHDNAVGAKMVRRANELGDRYRELEDAIEEAESNGNFSDSELAQMDSVLTQYGEQLQDMVAKMDMTRFIIDATYTLR